MKKHGKWIGSMLCLSLLSPSFAWADLNSQVEHIRQQYEQQGYKLEGVSDEEIASMVERVVNQLKADSSVDSSNFDQKLINKSLSVINEPAYQDLKRSVLEQVTTSDIQKLLNGQVPDSYKPIRDTIYNEFFANAPDSGGSGGGGAGKAGAGGAAAPQPQSQGQKETQTDMETAAFSADAFKKLETRGSQVTITVDRERLLQAVKDLQNVKLIFLTMDEDVLSQADTVRVSFDVELLQGIMAAHAQAAIRIAASDVELDLPLAAFAGEPSGIQLEMERKAADQISQSREKFADGQIVVSPLSFRLDGLRLNGMRDGLNARLEGKKAEVLLRFSVPVQPVDGLTLLVWDPTAAEWRFVPTTVVQEKGRTILQTGRFVPGMYTVVRKDVHFADIHKHWARKEIETLAKKYLVRGVTPEKFQPNAPVTRAQFVSMISRLLPHTETGPSQLPWKDVQPDDWYASSLRIAYDAGLVKGDVNGNFLPDKRISREEMAAILVRLLANMEQGENGQTGGKDVAFADEGQISPWAKDAVQSIVAAGLMKGTGQGFQPKKATTRAEAAVVIHRLLEKMKWIE